ncbi:flagellar assembly protein FliW [Sulfurimonas sp.]|uniref:flagellar assembly protein FliW n=1 Tax=Sulfurimonas sp. TaxID=2022749 RepID=UPI0026134A7A|nr:flagellar assembly protein FliW [Sulfurimonas sp.]MCW8894660.1 flagellar assembly protein FliW [Sulfurimonas sp.]MCW9067109.1 flagellar assembly protein FliW [Sulfurimonas sp.]
MKFDICAPILGFEDVKQVTLEKIDDIFMKMQCTDNEHISFTLINPFVLREYDFELPDKISKTLDANKNSNLLVLNIVLIQTPIEDSVVNFIGPMIFNTDNNRAVQILLPESTKYGVAEKISTFLKK